MRSGEAFGLHDRRRASRSAARYRYSGGGALSCLCVVTRARARRRPGNWRAHARRAAPTDLCGAVRSAPTQRRDAEAFVPATSSILTRRRFGGTANRSAAAPVALGPSAPDTARPRPRRGSGRPPRAAACSRKGMAGRRLQTSGGVDHDVPAARRPPKDRRCGEPLPARRRR